LKKERSLWGGDLRKLSGFSEFKIVSVPLGDAVAFWKKLRKNFG